MSKPDMTIITKSRKENEEASKQCIDWLIENPNGVIVSTNLDTGEKYLITMRYGRLDIRPVVKKGDN